MIRKTVEDKNKPTTPDGPDDPRYTPSTIGSTALWAIDQSVCLTQAVVTLVLGIIFVVIPSQNSWLLIGYAVGFFGTVATYVLIIRKTPASYALDCIGSKVMGIGRFLKRIPGLRYASWGSLLCALALIIAGLVNGFIDAPSASAGPSSHHPHHPHDAPPWAHHAPCRRQG